MHQNIYITVKKKHNFSTFVFSHYFIFVSILEVHHDKRWDKSI